jgi:dTDP-4-dehydrorhamnose 3,5-epimerase
MEFIKQEIPEVVLIKPTIHADDRGYFAETFRQDLFEKSIGSQVNFIQDNESKSSRGVLRGLHYQLPPYTQAKLVRVIEGSVLDVAVDIRKSSPTFGQHIAIELSDKNKHQLFVPQGFAHGFLVLSDTATFAYKVDNYYSPDHERGIVFNDDELKINWQLPNKLIKSSKKDRDLPKLSHSSPPF